MTITGGCFCGQVRYQISGKLFDARSCHCSRCRKAFNAQSSAYALVNSTEFEWVAGEALLTTYLGKHGFGLGFCRVCGSTLCGLHGPDIHGVTLGCVDGDPNIEIGMHIYVASKAAWEVIPPNVTQYSEGPPRSQDANTE